MLHPSENKLQTFYNSLRDKEVKLYFWKIYLHAYSNKHDVSNYFYYYFKICIILKDAFRSHALFLKDALFCLGWIVVMHMCHWWHFVTGKNKVGKLRRNKKVLSNKRKKPTDLYQNLVASMRLHNRLLTDVNDFCEHKHAAYMLHSLFGI